MQRTPTQLTEDAEQLAERRAAPSREIARTSDTQAIEVAKLLVQALLLLHGGALVTLPAFSQYLTGSIQGWASINLLALVFSAGLISALLAGVAAFFSLANRGDQHMIVANALTHRAWAQQNDIEHMVTNIKPFEDASKHLNSVADELDKEADPFRIRFLRWRTAAVWLILLSLGCVVFAAIVATRTLVPPIAN